MTEHEIDKESSDTPLFGRALGEVADPAEVKEARAEERHERRMVADPHYRRMIKITLFVLAIVLAVAGYLRAEWREQRRQERWQVGELAWPPAAPATPASL